MKNSGFLNFRGQIKSMKQLRYLFEGSLATVCLAIGLTTNAQNFPATVTGPVSLDGASGSCATPGTNAPNVFRIPVTGVGMLSATKKLVRVNVQLSNCGSGTVNLNNVQIRLVSPAGLCQGIYSGGLSSVASGTHTISLVEAASCLNNPNTNNSSTVGAPPFGSGNQGVFNAQFSGTPANFSSYSGMADGDWLLVFSETTTTPPCLVSAELSFGLANVQDQETAGETCSNPIIWDGNSPLCASTSGKLGSTEMPGSLGGANSTQFGTIGGQTCEWNNANNNDVWIAYTATTDFTCLTISGIDQNLQSVVVSDANVDGDNQPCTGPLPTGGNDSRWTLVSCPRNAIYSATSGTSLNQQHCFTSQPGKTYYLVVDGNGGANSSFYVWGSASTTIPVRFGMFQALNRMNQVDLMWTALNEQADSFAVERSLDGLRFQSIASLPVFNSAQPWLRQYSFSDFTAPASGTIFYRIKAYNRAGLFRYTPIRQVERRAGEVLAPKARILQNPVVGNRMLLYSSAPIARINLYSMSGQKLAEIATQLQAGNQIISIPAQVRGQFVAEFVYPTSAAERIMIQAQ